MRYHFTSKQIRKFTSKSPLLAPLLAERDRLRAANEDYSEVNRQIGPIMHRLMEAERMLDPLYVAQIKAEKAHEARTRKTKLWQDKVDKRLREVSRSVPALRLSVPEQIESIYNQICHLRRSIALLGYARKYENKKRNLPDDAWEYPEMPVLDIQREMDAKREAFYADENAPLPDPLEILDGMKAVVGQLSEEVHGVSTLTDDERCFVEPVKPKAPKPKKEYRIVKSYYIGKDL